MSFGLDLKRWRKHAGMTQEQLAIAAGVSVPYISNLERDFSANTRSGKPRASEELCAKLAKALRIDEDDIRESAGWLPVAFHKGRPESLLDLLKILESLGVDHSEFADTTKLQTATPDELQEVLDSLRVAVEVSIARILREKERDG